MWFWTRRQKEAKELLADAQLRDEEMKPAIRKLDKYYRENHIYATILQTLGGS